MVISSRRIYFCWQKTFCVYRFLNSVSMFASTRRFLHLPHFVVLLLSAMIKIHSLNEGTSNRLESFVPKVLFMYRMSTIERSRLSLEFSSLEKKCVRDNNNQRLITFNKPAADQHSSCAAKHPNGDLEASSYSAAGKVGHSLKC